MSQGKGSDLVQNALLGAGCVGAIYACLSRLLLGVKPLIKYGCRGLVFVHAYSLKARSIPRFAAPL
jgi:hypothetical protein